MTARTPKSIDDRLDAEHTDTLADEGLRARARQALPALRERLTLARAEADDLMHEASSSPSPDRTFRRNGGEDAYAAELGLQNAVVLLERLLARAARDGWHGWTLRNDVERALRLAGG